MKKFVNRPEDAVEEMLQGLAVLHPGSTRLPGYKVLLRADAASARERQVAVLSGGGSGHEPAHAGYIGEGMLSAAVAGEIFTSPSSDSVYAAIQAIAGKPGSLLVVKNYTGDRLNFGLAAEMARAEGIPVEMVIVNDDVALTEKGSDTGARGLAGTILIHKLLGAAAAEGRNLDDLAVIGKAAVEHLATMGVSFSAGTSPTVGRPGFELGEEEMELGLGIHGEPGVKRMQLQPADELTETLLAKILQHGKFGAAEASGRDGQQSWSNHGDGTRDREPPRSELSRTKRIYGRANLCWNIPLLARYGRNLNLRSRCQQRALALARRGNHGSCLAQCDRNNRQEERKRLRHRSRALRKFPRPAAPHKQR